MSIKVEARDIVQKDVPDPVIIRDTGVLLCEIDSTIVCNPSKSALSFIKNIDATMSHNICNSFLAGDIDVRLESEKPKIVWPPFKIPIWNQRLNVGKEFIGGGLEKKEK